MNITFMNEREKKHPLIEKILSLVEFDPMHENMGLPELKVLYLSEESKKNILDKVDHLIIGGGMSFTFIKAQGGKIGNSICEDDKQELALDILKQAKAKGVQVHIPVDVIAADDFSNDANTQICDIDNIPDGWEGVDAGPKSREIFDKIVNMDFDLNTL